MMGTLKMSGFSLEEKESPKAADIENGSVVIHPETSQMIDMTNGSVVIHPETPQELDMENGSIVIHSESSESLFDLPNEEKQKLTELLARKEFEKPDVHNAIMDTHKARAIVRFVSAYHHISCDIDVPLDITANDLVNGLNAAFGLKINVSDARQCFLCSTNPIALLKGKRLLGEFGIHDGSLIMYQR